MNRPPIQERPTWAELHEVNPWLFPSVLKLAKDRGPIGQLLSKLPEEALVETEKSDNAWLSLADYARQPKEEIRVGEARLLNETCDKLLAGGVKRTAFGIYTATRPNLGVKEVRFPSQRTTEKCR